MNISILGKKFFRAFDFLSSPFLYYALLFFLVDSQAKANNVAQTEFNCDFISFMILEDNTCIDLTSFSEEGRLYDWVEVHRDAASSFFILPISIQRVDENIFSVRVREVFEYLQENQFKRAESTYSVNCESATVEARDFSYTDGSGNPFNDDRAFEGIINDLEEGSFDENSLRAMLAISSLELQSMFEEQSFITEGPHINKIQEYICSGS